MNSRRDRSSSRPQRRQRIACGRRSNRSAWSRRHCRGSARRDTVDVDLPRIAIYTTWSNTEKVGWVRLAFDRWEIPFDLIHKDHVRAGANLRAKYDVIVMPHQTQQRQGDRLRTAEALEATALQEERQVQDLRDVRRDRRCPRRHGDRGRRPSSQKFVDDGGLLMTFGVASFFPGRVRARHVQLTRSGRSGTWYAPGPYVQSEILRPEHPVVFGYSDKTLPVRWADGPILQARRQIRNSPAFVGSTPDRTQRDRAFQGGDAGVLSGLMRGADQIRNRPMVVDAPSGKGRVLLFANNPIYRWQTFGEHAMVFNALLFHNDFPAPPPSRQTTQPAVGARVIRIDQAADSSRGARTESRAPSASRRLRSGSAASRRPIRQSACRRRTRTRTYAAGAA